MVRVFRAWARKKGERLRDGFCVGSRAAPSSVWPNRVRGALLDSNGHAAADRPGDGRKIDVQQCKARRAGEEAERHPSRFTGEGRRTKREGDAPERAAA